MSASSTIASVIRAMAAAKKRPKLTEFIIARYQDLNLSLRGIEEYLNVAPEEPVNLKTAPGPAHAPRSLAERMAGVEMAGFSSPDLPSASGVAAAFDKAIEDHNRHVDAMTGKPSARHPLGAE